MFQNITSNTSPMGTTIAHYVTDDQRTVVEFHPGHRLEGKPLKRIAVTQVVSRVFDLRHNLQRAEQHLPHRVVTM